MKHVLAFFAASDGIVLEMLGRNGGFCGSQRRKSSLKGARAVERGERRCCVFFFSRSPPKPVLVQARLTSALLGCVNFRDVTQMRVEWEPACLRA